MKRLLVYMLAGVSVLGMTSCSDFLDTVPHDALSPATTWQTEDDAQKFLVGCYDGWADANEILYLDCGSDFGYNNFQWESWKTIGNGSMSAANEVYNLYSFSMIRRCNTFLENIDKVEFSDESVKNDMIGQVRTIRAYQYFDKNWWYGGVPIIENYETAEEAQVARNTEEEVKQFIYDELDAAIPLLNETPKSRGYIAKGTALAIKMRSALYYGDYERAKEAAQAIMDLKQYELDPDYANIFTVAGQGSKEIIASVQYIENLKTLYTIGQMYPNADGGWSSIVPTQNLVDTYEMDNGLTKEEAGDYYDPAHPFAHRDPRMAMTIIFPGQDWNGRIFNTLDKQIVNAATGAEETNGDYPANADNASKTALSWNKYLGPKSQYADMWSTNACPIVFRYAEVLLTYAEAENELNGPSAKVYDLLNQIRNRVGMPDVDQSKYGTQSSLRELIRRERSVELAGEGLRRADILRWKDANGKMVAETVLNGPLTRIIGTVDHSGTDPYTRATITRTDELIENRSFAVHNRYFPMAQSDMDANPNLKQNPGY
ncbi:MAG TPA: RagB/SusD family nutrient uptake outer membrane protein [Candidatus Parabacteroides faecavium]|nr:RagB/SusD family nutrient uptake outer membrane protein [Candidatus Parabacteroides faecavium]